MRFSRWHRWLLVMIGVLMAAVSAAAQSENDIWFWAWRPYDLKVEKAEDQRGDVLAFTPDGTNNVLLEDVFPIVLRRMDDTHAFVGAKHEDVYHLYYLTPTEAIEVMLLFDQAYMEELRGYAIYEGYPFYMPQIVPAGVGRYLIGDTKQDQYALFDAATNTTTPLDLRPWCEEDCIRVSEDGRYIRYRVPPANPLNPPFFDTDPFALPYQIYEYDTTTQTERLIFEQHAPDLSEEEMLGRADCTPDQYGERWYCELFLNDHSLADEKLIISLNGSIQPVNPAWQLRVFEGRWYFLDLDRDHRNCEPCTIRVFPDGDESRVFDFKVPLGEELSFWYDQVELLSEKYLTPDLRIGRLSAMSPSGETILLGERPCCADPISQDFYDPVTGYAIVINATDIKNPKTELWSTRPLERIASFPLEVQPGVRSTFRDYSLVLFREVSNGDPLVVYSYIDKTLYEFDFERVHFYIDAFPGGILMVDSGDSWPEGTFAEANDGLSRWTPEEGETRLLDGVTQIPDY